MSRPQNPPARRRGVSRGATTACAALVLAAAGAAAAPAQAAPPWSAGAPIAAGPAPRLEANFVNQAEPIPAITGGLAGPQVATWWSGFGDDARRQLVAIDAGRVVRVRTSSVVVASARYARSRTLHVDAKRTGDYRGFPTVAVAARVGAADLSSFGTARAIGGPRTVQGAVRLAANESGAAVVAWKHVRAGRRPEIQYATRPAGGRFGPVRSLAADADDVATTEVAVGVDPGGRAVVAYGRNTVRRGATRLALTAIDTRTGRAAAETRVAPPPRLNGPTEVTVGTAQRVRGLPIVIAWRGYPVTEGPTGRVDTAAAVLRPGSARLDAAQPLADGRVVAYPRGPIRAVVDAAGRPVVAWGEITPSATRDRAGERTVPTVAQADAAGRFGSPQALDTGGAIGSLVAVDEGVAVGWVAEGPGIEGHGDSGAVRVARRGPDGSFGAPEDVDDRTIASGPLRTSVDGLQPPGLGARIDGGLTAVYADVGANAQGGEMRLSSRPAG